MTTTIDRAIELNVPVSTAYDQWTQFEDFALFMDGVERIEQETDERLRWKVRRRGVTREFGARITEQYPDLRIAWTATGSDDPDHHGVVTFHHLGEGHSRMMLQLRFEPSGFFEQYADKTGLIERWVDDNLGNFKSFIEQRGKPTGSWRGRIENEQVTQDAEHRRHDDHATTTTTSGQPTDSDQLRRVEDSSSQTGQRTTPREAASSGATPAESADQHRAVDHKDRVS